MDLTTAGLARMNMILHDFPTANILSGNTLSDPKFKDAKEDAAVLKQWLSLNTEEADLKKAIREAETELDLLACQKYPQLTEPEVQTLVVDDKWLTTLAAAI